MLKNPPNVSLNRQDIKGVAVVNIYGKIRKSILKVKLRQTSTTMSLYIWIQVYFLLPVHSPEDASDEETPPGELDEGGDPGVGGTQVDGLHHLVDVVGGGGEIGGGEHGAVSAAEVDAQDRNE